MQITFLGTSAGVPTRTRNVSCVALRLPQRGEVWLFDCGEGTQHQLLRSDVKLSRVSRIFITHLHGDHFFGLVGLLATAGMAASATRIDVYGPPGLEDYIRVVEQHSKTAFSELVEVHTIEPGTIFQDDEIEVRCRPLVHRVPTFGFRVTERDQQGHFDVEKAIDLGIPSGPLFGELKQGREVTLPDGRTFNGQEFCGPPIKGRHVVYCTDTIYCPQSVELSEDADVLIHEATFGEEDVDLARRSLHSTAKMAAQVALEARAKLLILTHFSPRYAPGQPVQLEDLHREARSVFPWTEMAHDLLTIEIPRTPVESR